MTDKSALVFELTCGDDTRAEAAAQALAAYQAEVIPLLKTLLSSAEVDTRWWATLTLGCISHPSVTPLLLRSLHDPQTEVRYCAAIALREQPDPTAIPALISFLGNRDPMLARLAADALAAIGTAATPALIAVMENGSYREVIHAVRALSRIGDYRAIPALYNALTHDSAIIQHWADKGLDDLGVGTHLFHPE